MGDVLNQVEQTLQQVHDWFVWVAVALMLLVVINLVTGSFVVWGMLRIAKLSEINRFPRNPAAPDQAVLYGGAPANYSRQP